MPSGARLAASAQLRIAQALPRVCSMIRPWSSGGIPVAAGQVPAGPEEHLLEVVVVAGDQVRHVGERRLVGRVRSQPLLLSRADGGGHPVRRVRVGIVPPADPDGRPIVDAHDATVERAGRVRLAEVDRDEPDISPQLSMISFMRLSIVSR